MKKVGYKDIAALIFTAALFGTAFPAIKVALRFLSPLSIATFRIAVAAIVLYGIGLFKADLPIKISQNDSKTLFYVSLFAFIFPFVLVSWAETIISSAAAAILFSFGPLIGSIVAHLTTDDDKINSRRAIGILIGFIGLSIILGWSSFRELKIDQLQANIAIILSTLSHALSSISIRKIKADALNSFTKKVLLLSSLILLPFALIIDQPWKLPSLGQSLLIMGYLGAFPTALAYFIRFRQIHQLGYAFVSNTGYLVPCFATLISISILGESIKISIWLGFILILSGILLNRR